MAPADKGGGGDGRADEFAAGHSSWHAEDGSANAAETSGEKGRGVSVTTTLCRQASQARLRLDRINQLALRVGGKNPQAGQRRT